MPSSHPFNVDRANIFRSRDRKRLSNDLTWRASVDIIYIKPTFVDGVVELDTKAKKPCFAFTPGGVRPRDRPHRSGAAAGVHQERARRSQGGLRLQDDENGKAVPVPLRSV